MRIPGKPFRSGFILLLIVPLAGCTLSRKKQAAVPPPPAPAVAPAPEAQLSVPQTSVVLPSPQPLNPDAIPPIVAQKPAAEKPETVAPAPRAARRPAAPKTEPEQEVETPPVEQPAVQPAIQPIMSADEQKRIQGNIDVRRREIDDLLGRAKAHASSHNVSLTERITSFLSQSAEAARRGDFPQADTLSERALILARELRIE